MGSRRSETGASAALVGGTGANGRGEVRLAGGGAVRERATPERAARWLTSRAALSVGCGRAVRVGLERRCWAGHAGPSRKGERLSGRCWAAVSLMRERTGRTRESGRGEGRRRAAMSRGLGSGKLLGPRRSLGRGELGRAERVLGFLGFGLFGLRVWVFFFLLFSFLNLIQTKFEFKFEFEFKPHSNKSMHQHECNKNLNL